MKRVIVLFCALLLLCGCSRKSETPVMPTETCDWCGDKVDRWVPTEDGELCARCFIENHLMICSECGLAYYPDATYTSDGLCGSCEDDLVWSCAVCGTAHAVKYMCHLGDGHYICVPCTEVVLVEMNDLCVSYGGENRIEQIIADSVTYARNQSD